MKHKTEYKTGACSDMKQRAVVAFERSRKAHGLPMKPLVQKAMEKRMAKTMQDERDY